MLESKWVNRRKQEEEDGKNWHQQWKMDVMEGRETRSFGQGVVAEGTRGTECRGCVRD